MNSESERLIRREIAANERLLWSGVPEQGLRLQASDIFLVPFSLVWCGFACFWEFMAVSSQNTPFFFKLWGIPFVVIGLYMVIGRFFADAFQRSRTYYGLTDERVVIISGIFFREVTSLMLHALAEVSFREHTNGRGTIVFGPADRSLGADFSRGWRGSARRVAPSFDAIDDARRVHDLLRQLRAADRRPNA